MNLVIAIIAIAAFVLSSTQASVALIRWWREPTFRVLDATIARAGDGKMRYIPGGRLTILALGGARTRTIVNWRISIGEEGSRAMGGSNLVVEPISQVIPEHGATKFDLNVASGIFVGEAERLHGILVFDVGRYKEQINFAM